MKRIILFAFILSLMALNACKKETEDFTSDPIEAYAPLAIGKYITYQLDSLRYLPFSTQDTTTIYQVKEVIDSLIKDNLGRPSYRIIRYIRKTAGDEWVPDNTFMVLNTGSTLEFIENNQRYLKLKLPFRDGFQWKGNGYIDTYSLNSNVRYLDDWNYTYEAVNQPFTLGNIQLDSTLKVNQRDEIVGNPDDPASYSEKNFSMEVYARGIGMVYRKFLHTEFQPDTPGSPGGYSDETYGVTFTMIDHN